MTRDAGHVSNSCQTCLHEYKSGTKRSMLCPIIAVPQSEACVVHTFKSVVQNEAHYRVARPTERSAVALQSTKTPPKTTKTTPKITKVLEKQRQAT